MFQTRRDLENERYIESLYDDENEGERFAVTLRAEMSRMRARWNARGRTRLRE